MFIVYVLKSIKYRKFYIGHTDNMARRLQEHNAGITIYSSRHAPWEVVYTETFAQKMEAVKREKYFKSAAGRRWLKKNIGL